MIELIGYFEGPFTGVSVLVAVVVLARVIGVKDLIALVAQHVELRAAVRMMRGAGASEKAVVRFIAEHAKARAGRSP